jgi:hypothetical protein
MAAIRAPESGTKETTREDVEPFARQILDFVRETDPEATYLLAPPIDPGTWIMYLFVRPDLVEDFDFSDRIVSLAFEIQFEHDVDIATLLRDRTQGMRTGSMLWSPP